MDAAAIVKKLNVARSGRAWVVSPPDVFEPVVDYLRDTLALHVDVRRNLPRDVRELDAPPLDAPPHDTLTADPAYGYVHVFVTSVAGAAEVLPVAADALAEDGRLWVSYPKRSSTRYASDLSRDGDGWAPLYALNFEPVSQVSIDEDWSALRFRPVARIARFTRGFARSELGKKRLVD